MTVALALAVDAGNAQQAGGSAAGLQSAQNSLEYLRRVMDQYHDRFPVYEDISSPGNHFHAWGKLPAGAPVNMNGTWTENPHSGATAIQCQFAPTPTMPFGGFYLQNGVLQGEDRSPQLNWGTVPNAGVDLTGATALTFWARGAAGGEQIDFFLGGVGRVAQTGVPLPDAPFPDSSPRLPAFGNVYALTTSWQKFTIDLTGANLSYILGGFGWVADSSRNPSGVVFFLDDIQYELSASRKSQRLSEPRFLRSFSLLPLQPDPFDGVQDGDIDFVLRNLAFVYDNALAVQAFLVDGSSDSIRRARLIGDAFVYAMQHDRAFNDNRACGDAVDPVSLDGARLRSAYSAGDLSLPPGWTPNGRAGTVPIPGFYAEATKMFYEVEQEAVDVGNNLWALIALEALYQRTGAASYLDAACKLGNFVHSLRNETGAFQGFAGGVNNPETSPARRMYASTEHNLDANAAFTTLFQLTGEPRWQQDASHARQFVEAMWNTGNNCYLAGTTDPNTRNTAPGQLPLDVQAWSILSLPSPAPHLAAVDCAETNHWNTHDGFTGFDFNDDKDGVWFEGTAQMAVAEARANRADTAEGIRGQLRLAQHTPPFGDLYGIASASHDGVSTGFQTAGGYAFKYFRRLHVAVAAWNVFAQLNANPYYSRTLTVSVSAGGSVATPLVGACSSTCSSAWIDGAVVTLSAAPAAGWVFGSWTGACAGSSMQCTVSMTAARGVVAMFARVVVPGVPQTGGGDYDGDRKADVTVYRPSTGNWYVLKSSTGFQGYSAYAWGVPGDLPEQGDFDGDGKLDIAIYRPTTGQWWILWSSTNFATYNVYGWGLGGDTPAPADYDGDGKTDIAIYRPTTGGWWILRSSSGFTTYDTYGWGLSGDIPIAGDFDGDGKADPAIYRPTTGGWWVLKSSTNYAGYSQYGWGLVGDTPVSADYDGDKKADIAVYRPLTGGWWILWSSTNYTTYGLYGWGLNGDVPVPADYDGDGKTDIAVYRPTTAGWWILKSGTSFGTYSTYAWGLAGDVPVLKRP